MFFTPHGIVNDPCIRHVACSTACKVYWALCAESNEQGICPLHRSHSCSVLQSPQMMECTRKLVKCCTRLQFVACRHIEISSEASLTTWTTSSPCPTHHVTICPSSSEEFEIRMLASAFAACLPNPSNGCRSMTQRSPCKVSCQLEAFDI